MYVQIEYASWGAHEPTGNPPEIVCDENEDEEKKWQALKNNLIERTGLLSRCEENARMDFSEVRVNDSLHIEGTNTVVMG